MLISPGLGAKASNTLTQLDPVDSSSGAPIIRTPKLSFRYSLNASLLFLFNQDCYLPLIRAI